MTFRAQQISIFFDKLAQMQSAGLPLLEAFPLATLSVTSPPLRRILLSARAALGRGALLSDALTSSQGPDLFGPVCRALLRAGERHGHLDRAFADLAAFYDRSYRAQRDLLSALIYPAFLLTSSFLLPAAATWYVRGFFAYLAEVGAAISGFLLPLLAVALPAWFLHKRAPRLVENLLLRVPVLGRLLRQRALGRFCRAFSALLGAGVELRECLQIANQALLNQHLIAQAAPSALELARGQTLSDSLQASPVFPADLIQRIAIAERAGTLDDTLARAANGYEEDASRTQKLLLRAIPVLIFLFIALRVAQTIIGFYTGYLQTLDQVLQMPDVQLGP